MHEQFAPCSFLGDSVVLTKRQDIFSVLRVPGIDPECLDAAQLDHIVQRFEAALRILGPEYRVYQYILKRDSPELPTAEHPSPIILSRQEWLKERSEQLYSVELYLVILREKSLQDSGTARTLSAHLISRFSTRETLQASRKELDRQSELLTTAVSSLVVQLQDTVRPYVLDRVKTVGFLRRLVNYTPWKAGNGCRRPRLSSRSTNRAVERRVLAAVPGAGRLPDQGAVLVGTPGSDFLSFVARIALGPMRIYRLHGMEARGQSQDPERNRPQAPALSLRQDFHDVLPGQRATAAR